MHLHPSNRSNETDSISENSILKIPLSKSLSSRQGTKTGTFFSIRQIISLSSRLTRFTVELL